MKEILGDLLADVTDQLGEHASAEEGVSLLLKDQNGRTIAQLVLNTAAAAALIKAAMPSKMKVSPLLASRVQAVQEQQVALELRAGSARITIDALRDLSSGDVLLLDRRLDQGLELGLHSRGTSIAGVEVKVNGEQTEIQVQYAIR